jgi:hypothetical protein
METILNIINNFDLSQNTIKNYTSQFKTIHNALSVNDSLEYINDIDTFINYLEGLNSTSSKRLKAALISKILQTNENKFSVQIQQLRDYLQNLGDREIVKEFKPEITLNDVKNKVKDIVNDDKAKLLLMLITNHPPLRGDYNTIKLKNFDTTVDNYYDGNSLIFNKLMKIDNDIKPIKLNATEKLIADNIKAEGGNFLFEFASIHGFHEYLKRISEKYIGKKQGIQFYRRLYTSTKLDGFIDMNKKANNLARDMNHSRGTQSKYYLHQI